MLNDSVLFVVKLKKKHCSCCLQQGTSSQNICIYITFLTLNHSKSPCQFLGQPWSQHLMVKIRIYFIQLTLTIGRQQNCQSAKEQSTEKNNSFLWKCIPKCTLFNSFRCRICSVPVRLLWAFPLFCHPMSNDAPIATFSFSLSSFHRFLSLSKLSRHDSFANFSIWGLTFLSRAFSVDSPSDGTLI